MPLELKQVPKLVQQTIMTPQLQQSIKLLQLSRLELTNLIQKEIVENPVLEESQDLHEGEDTPEIDNTKDDQVAASAVMYCAAKFTSSKPVESGDTLKVAITISMQNI